MKESRLAFCRRPAVAAAVSVLAPASARAVGRGDTVALPVREALAALPLQSEDRTGYERTVPALDRRGP
ncbi:hypothetical protein GCM10010521_75210 [Streptomyces rameus]|uniref:Uncharacterized protein n=1 Tax=Streptomyces rameus TaxID=68261 RepID=A0ABN3VA62_9ACTN